MGSERNTKVIASVLVIVTCGYTDISYSFVDFKHSVIKIFEKKVRTQGKTYQKKFSTT